MLINVSNVARSSPFYRGMFRYLGYDLADSSYGDDYAYEDWKRWDLDTPHEISICQVREGYKAERYRRGALGHHDHIAFCALDREDVDVFYRDVLAPLEKAGHCSVEDPPCDCPEYGEGYYATFFFDPDGLKYEYVFNPNHLLKRQERLAGQDAARASGDCVSVSGSSRCAEEAIRCFRHGDHFAIAEIFSRAIHEIASKDYTVEQCLAWSSREPNPKHWEVRCALKRPFVAITDSQIAGFLELDSDGHIDCAYVNPDFQRRGVMTRLVAHSIQVCFAMGLPRVYVEASICAKPLFQKLGFDVLCENAVEIGGVSLVNYLMELRNPKAAGVVQNELS